MSIVYKNSSIQLEVVTSEVPWFKISLIESGNLLPQKQEILEKEVLRVIDTLNQAMIEFFKPDKINIIIMGNSLPEYYWYVIARFENDSYFPKEMRGEKQREEAIIYIKKEKLISYLLKYVYLSKGRSFFEKNIFIIFI